jgi:F420H(2)-dependent quinone reductase
MRALEVVDRCWPAMMRVMGMQTVLYRATGGRVGHHVPGMPPMLLLDHIGAKSGERRTTPLIYTLDGDSVILVGSKGGYPRNPAWFHNLTAHPETMIQIGRERRAVRARPATPEEYPRMWAKAVEAYGTYAICAERTEREIPVVVLESR